MEARKAMIGASTAMTQVFEDLGRVAPLDTTILLQGESGTGKELAARRLHDGHPVRSSGPFVAIHCGAIAESLLESELFGHEKGAFTGADAKRDGCFVRANGGTLFLDEIGTMKPDAQTRLLRVLQERMVTPVGTSQAKPIDVRIVVATNEDLLARVEAGEFRADLYYRIATFPIEIPALRERGGDVPDLAAFLLQKVCDKLRVDRCPRLSAGAISALSSHPWPGNVRELENAMEYAAVKSMGEPLVCAEHLPASVLKSRPTPRSASRLTAEGLSFRTAIGELERELILNSLDIAGGNKARAAELLELKRTTFLEKLRRIEGEASGSAVSVQYN